MGSDLFHGFYGVNPPIVINSKHSNVRSLKHEKEYMQFVPVNWRGWVILLGTKTDNKIHHESPTLRVLLTKWGWGWGRGWGVMCV